MGRLIGCLVVLAACGGGGAMSPRVRCEKTVDHLRAIMPKDMSPEREDDVKECLNMPQKLVECLRRTPDAAGARACVDDYKTEKYGTAERPSRERCAEAVAHVRELAPDLTDEDAAGLVDDCVSEGRPAEVDCLLAAGTLEEAQSCAGR